MDTSRSLISDYLSIIAFIFIIVELKVPRCSSVLDSSFANSLKFSREPVVISEKSLSLVFIKRNAW